MDELLYILKIIFYFLFVILTYFSALKSKNTNKIKFIVIMFLGLIIGYYAIICGPSENIGDRYNYALRFSNDYYLPFVKINSLGLYYIEVFLHLFSHNPKALYFTIGIIYFLLTMIAYNTYDKTEPIVLLLLGLSSYGLFGFYLYKQALAIALVSISIAYFLKEKKVKCIFFLILSTLFHESTWIMIPLYLIIIFSEKNKVLRILSYLLFVLCIIFFKQISKNLISIFNYIPGIGLQMSSYLDNDGSILIDMNFLTIIKGLPYYIITIYGIIMKPSLACKIKNYNKYLIISTFCSFATILSMYMYWMWRFAAYCYFPVFIFAALIYKNDTTNKNSKLFISIVTFLLFVLTLKLLIQYYFIYGGIV